MLTKVKVMQLTTKKETNLLRNHIGLMTGRKNSYVIVNAILKTKTAPKKIATM
jgi:hypothetical protein